MVAAADSSRMALSYGKETTFGVPPTTSNFYRYLRVVSHSLQQDTATGKSSEVVADRNITSVRRLGVGGSGDIVCELSKDTGFEELIKSCLQFPGAWTVPAPLTGTVSVTAPNLINDSAAGLGGISPDGFIQLTGFANAANNRPMQVTSVSATQIAVKNSDLVTEAAGGSKDLGLGGMINNSAVAAGSEIDSYSFEDEFTDLTNEFAVHAGVTIDGFTINVTAEGFVTITFSTMGAGEVTPRPTSQRDGGTRIAAGTALQFTAVDDVVAIMDGTNEQLVTNFSINVANGNHGRKVAGTRGPHSIGTGLCTVTGSLTSLFLDSTLVDKHLNYTETSLVLMLKNGTADSYVFEIPSLHYNKGATPNVGQSQDVIAELPWEAQKESTVPLSGTARAAIRVWKFL